MFTSSPGARDIWLVPRDMISQVNPSLLRLLGQLGRLSRPVERAKTVGELLAPVVQERRDEYGDSGRGHQYVNFSEVRIRVQYGTQVNRSLEESCAV